MTISQTQIVDYLNKKLGYGVAKTDVSTAKSPSNESNASPLLTTGGTIWQLSSSIPATIPTSNSSVVTLYNDSISSTIRCTVDPSTSILNETWRTNLTDWIPPQFGSSYQVKLYAAPAGALTPQTTGVPLPSDGSGNNDAWFFDYQAGIVNFADTNVPTAVTGNVVYVVGARYVGQKGISNFPNGLTMGNASITGNATIGGNIVVTGTVLYANGQSVGGTTYSNANVASYLTGTVSIGNVITTSGIFWANGVSFAPATYSNANVSAYLPTDTTILSIVSNLGNLTSNAGNQATTLNAINANLGTATTNLTALYANAATQQVQITSLYTGANANTAAYLLGSGPIAITSVIDATDTGTGAFQVTGGASIGANLYVGGNLIVQGNVYELQTEIISQNEVVTNNLYAGAYFWANGEPLNYGNVQVEAYLPLYTGSLANSTDIISLYANAGSQSNQITGANTRIQILDANLGTATTNITTLFGNAATQAQSLATINANLGTATNNIATLFANAAGQAQTLTTINANLGTATNNINTLFSNAASQATTLNTHDANLGTATTNITTLFSNAAAQAVSLIAINANLATTNGTLTALHANVGAYELYANSILNSSTTDLAELQANVGAYEIYANANLGTATTNISVLQANVGAYHIWSNANAALQQTQIASLATNANANTAAYLLGSGPITVASGAQTTTANTGALQVWGGASIGANLYVSGNLIVQGNSYVLQTEILAQNEVVTNNMYAGGYFWANGEPFQSSSYGNSNVAAYLPTYAGNISSNNIFASGTIYAANVITAGQYGNITGVTTIFANTFAFAANGVNILSAVTAYGNSNVASYLTANTVTIGNIITNNGLFWANGVNALAPLYGNTQVAAYLPIHTGNISGNNLSLSGSAIRFTSGATGTGMLSGSLASIVNNPYVFNGSYALSTTTPTAQNTLGNVSLQLGGVSFCVQFWLYLSASPATSPVIFGKDQNTIPAPIEFYGTINSSSIYFSTTSGVNTASSYSFTPQVNTWYHIAWTCDGTYYRTFVNGQMGTPTLVTAGTITNANGPLYVGSSARGTNYLTGMIEDFRIDRGVPVYTAPFTPPANYLGSGSNTVYYLKNWTSGAGLSTTTDYTAGTGFYNVRMVGSLSHATNTQPAPFTTTSGQGIFFDGISNWYSTSGFQVQSTAGAISTTSGALQVTGGAGIIGNLHAGNITTAGTTTTAGLSVSGNISAGNIATGAVTATGNVSANAFLSTQYLYPNGVSILTGVSSTYGNSNVAAYLPTDLTITGIQANIGSFYAYANANAVTQSTSINTLNANLGAYQIYANGILSSHSTAITNIVTGANSNVASYLTTATGNISAGNVLTSSLRYANGVPYVFGSTYSNSNVASYLTTYSGNISASNFFAPNYLYANGLSILTGVGGIYSNANVASYLPVYTGDISSGNLVATGNVTSNYLLGNLISTGNVVVGNITTIGSYGNITGANVISANTFVFGGNGVSILAAIPTGYTNANAAAYLQSGTGPIVVASDTQATTANTGALQVWGGTSISANLYVGGNLIVQGNSYVLQTEILAQSEIVSNSMYAQAYFYGNGTPLNYGNVQVAAYLPQNPTIYGIQANLGAYQAYANLNISSLSVQTGDLFGSVGDIYSNLGLVRTDLTHVVTTANANTAAYLTTYTGNINAGNINAVNDVTIGGNLRVLGNSTLVYTTITQETITGTEIVAGTMIANSGAESTSTTTGALQVNGGAGITGNVFANKVYSTGFFYANGTPFVSSDYGNTQVGAYLLTNTGNIAAGNVLTESLRYANGMPYVFGSTYSNANVASYLTTYTGNISAGNVISTFYGNVHTNNISGINGNLVLTPASDQITVVNSTSALQLPKGTSLDRPTGSTGYLRFNTDGNTVEFFDGVNWVAAINSITQQSITGDGVTKNFILDQLTTAVGILVSINGTVQQPNIAYAVSGTQIAFAEAPVSTDIVDIRFMVSASATIVDTMIVDSGNVAVGTSTVTLDTWSMSTYRSAKYTISSSNGTESQMSEILVIHNGTTSFSSNTTLKTGVNSIDFTATVSSGNVLLQAIGSTINNQLRIQRTYFEI